MQKKKSFECKHTTNCAIELYHLQFPITALEDLVALNPVV